MMTMMPCPVQVFGKQERESAIDWLRSVAEGAAAVAWARGPVGPRSASPIHIATREASVIRSRASACQSTS